MVTLAAATFLVSTLNSSLADTAPVAPSAIVPSPDGKTLFVGCAAANYIAVFDTTSNQITRRLHLPDPPSGLAVSRAGTRL